MIKLFLTLVCNLVLLSGCSDNSVPVGNDVAAPGDTLSARAKFEPPDNKAILILGQDLGAIGGFSAPNNDGYVDGNGFPIPAGATTYTGISLDGVKTRRNWGAGDVHAQAIIDNPIYDNSVLVIGYYLVDQLTAINNGNWDDKIDELGQWIIDCNRPVFLRIGYEFDGPWFHYDPVEYINAFRRISNRMDKLGVDNVAHVWQSYGEYAANALLKWYPGDEYVDWMSYSHFDHFGNGMLELARRRNKPVLIAEATPKGHFLDNEYGEAVWNHWFVPLFKHIETNKDVIKGLAYINVDWHSQPMWNDGTWGDSRVQVNAYIKSQWMSEISSNFWLHGDSSLFDTLGYIHSSTSMGENTRLPNSVK